MTMRRGWMTALATTGWLMLGASGQIERSGGSPTGVDAHASSGTGVVEAKDPKHGTVTISGQLYSVAPTTRILDKTGQPIPLESLPVARIFRDEPMVDTAALVEFSASETGHGWVLESVKVQAKIPR
jgi:hypothetical protein